MTWTTRPRSEIGGLMAIQAGSGRSVLLLHGVGLRAEAWGPQLDELSHQAHLTAPDLPGHGDSPPLCANTGLSGYSDAAMAVLARLRAPTVVVGHSMGAMIALDLAVAAPERVCGVVAMNAVFERSAEAARAVQARAAELNESTPADPSTTLRRWFGDATSAERDACRAWLLAMNPTAYKMAYTAFAQSQKPDRADLANLGCPALFITGSLEPNSTPAMTRAMANLAPKGRAQIVEGAAHMMPMTHAHDVTAALSQFLDEVSG